MDSICLLGDWYKVRALSSHSLDGDTIKPMTYSRCLLTQVMLICLLGDWYKVSALSSRSLDGDSIKPMTYSRCLLTQVILICLLGDWYKVRALSSHSLDGDSIKPMTCNMWIPFVCWVTGIKSGHYLHTPLMVIVSNQ